MSNMLVRLCLSLLCSCALVVMWLANSTAAADSNVFYPLVQAAQQWQDAHPSACGQDTTTCGVQKMLSQFQACQAFRIVNGCPIGDQATYGWQVGVALGGALCSGTLVSPTHVVCAGHCVEGLTTNDASQITVFIGAKNLDSATSAQQHSVTRFSANPAYDSVRLTNDSSILELSTPVTFHQNGIRPACLPAGPVQRSLTSLIVGGYGIDNYKTQSGAGILRYTVLSVGPDATCRKDYGKDYNAYSTFCALGHRAKKNTDSCNGDSGSAVMGKSSSGVWALRGIVSYGTEQCGTAPGVYSDAFNCGIRASPAAIKRAAQQDKKTTDPCARSTGIKRRPVAGSTFNGKKLGGVGSDMAETIRLHGCKQNSECFSNVCREVEACHTPHDGNPANVTARNEQNELRSLRRAVVAQYRSPSAFTNVKQRPVRPVDQEAIKSQRPSLFQQRCTKINVCWLPAWAESFTTSPTFDFDTIAAENAEEFGGNGAAHEENGHKKP